MFVFGILELARWCFGKTQTRNIGRSTSRNRAKFGRSRIKQKDNINVLAWPENYTGKSFVFRCSARMKLNIGSGTDCLKKEFEQNLVNVEIKWEQKWLVNIWWRLLELLLKRFLRKSKHPETNWSTIYQDMNNMLKRKLRSTPGSFLCIVS